jgi:sec-independent protein translocase protein TatC
MKSPAQKSKPKTQPQKPRSEMSIWEHLDELRQRLVKAVIALVIGVIIGMLVTEPIILPQIIAPLGEDILIAVKPTETSSVFFKIAVVVGIVLAMPVIAYQLFQFVRPGLENKEQRYVLIGAPAASLFFAGGVVFAAKVLLPAAIPFLQGFLGEYIKPTYSIDFYLSFVTNIMLWAGLVFETPLVMYILALMNVVTADGFTKAWRVVVVGAAVGAAIITPTVDPVNMLLLMGPFLVLYGLGILLARLAQPRKKAAA